MVSNTNVIGRGGSSMRSGTPLICQVADFSSRSPGSFIDALLVLALHCRETMSKETFCLFPSEARGATWLSRFEENGVWYDFIPRDRHAFLRMRSLLKDHHPLIIHSHFVSYDVAAVALKLLFFRDAKIV